MVEHVSYVAISRSLGTRLSAGLAHYLEVFDGRLTAAQRQGVRVVAIKTPTSADFRSQIPNETEFDGAPGDLLAKQKIAFLDLSGALTEPKLYFDTDHLNRGDLTELFEKHLKSVLLATTAAQ